MTPAPNTVQPNQLQSYKLIRVSGSYLYIFLQIMDESLTDRFFMVSSRLFVSSLEANLYSQDKLNWSKYCKGQKSGYSNGIQIEFVNLSQSLIMQPMLFCPFKTCPILFNILN